MNWYAINRDHSVEYLGDKDYEQLDIPEESICLNQKELYTLIFNAQVAIKEANDD